MDSSTIAEWIAAAATSITAVLIVVTRRADMKPVIFTPGLRGSTWQSAMWAGDDAPNASIDFSNASVSQASQVQALGVDCQARLTQYEGKHVQAGSFVPRVASGETIGVYVRCGEESWSAAQVVIAWRESSPWRKKLREQIAVFKLVDLVKQPEFTDTNDAGELMRPPPVKVEPDVPVSLLGGRLHRSQVRLIFRRLRMLQRSPE